VTSWGVGAGSIASGLIGSFPVNASPRALRAVASASGRTQAAGLGAALALVALIPAAGLLKDLPLATLRGGADLRGDARLSRPRPRRSRAL